MIKPRKLTLCCAALMLLGTALVRANMGVPVDVTVPVGAGYVGAAAGASPTALSVGGFVQTVIGTPGSTPVSLVPVLQNVENPAGQGSEEVPAAFAQHKVGESEASQPQAAEAAASAVLPLPPKEERTEEEAREQRAAFSNYRLSVFEESPEKYALRYIFHVKESGPKYAGLVVGGVIHATMEQLYRHIQRNGNASAVTLKDVLKLYDEIWDQEVAETKGDLEVPKGSTVLDFKNGGKQFIRRQWERRSPFDKEGEIVSLEQRSYFDLKDPKTGKTWRFQIIIDRLTLEGDTLHIRDWKTHMTPPSLEQLRRDDYQLGLYALGVKALLPELVKGKKIELNWDFKEYTHSIVADEAYLAEIQERIFTILRQIDTYEGEVERNRAQWESRINPPKNPKGVRQAQAWVDRMGEIDGKIDGFKKKVKALEKEWDELQGGLVRFANKSGKTQIEGKTHRVFVTKKLAVIVPTMTDDPASHDAVVRILKEEGAWDEFSQLSYAHLKAMYKNGELEPRLAKKLEPYLKKFMGDDFKLKEK